MKIKSRAGRFLSILLVITMLVSVAALGLSAVSAAAGPQLTYDFQYANAGYAEGVITLKAGSSADYGTYYLYWANDSKALDGYAPIKSITLNTAQNYVKMGEFTAIPADATKVIATKSTTTKTVASAAAVYSIPADKQFKYDSSDKEYVFQTLSDIHFHRDGYQPYEYADEHFLSALNAAEERGAEFVSTCGDQTNYSDLKEWQGYLNTIAKSDFTGAVYEVNGNHEPYTQGDIGSSSYNTFLSQYRLASGLNAVTAKMQSELYYEITASNGDHHIYMALELVNNTHHPGISDNFSKAQMDWLEGLLNKYKNDGKKIFIYEHAPFRGYGAGDNKTSPHYGAAMTIDKALYPQTYRFKELLEANKNIVWFSGHTHIDFMYNYNFDNENGTTAYTVHVPSTASSTTVNASGGLDYVAKEDNAQGYFVDVYDDATVVNGTDMVKNEILPLYTYLVDYSGDKLVENDMPTQPDVNYEKVQVVVDVKALSENPSSVKVKLYGADDVTVTDEVTMAKATDGTYVANVSTQFTKMKFVVNGSTSGEYTVANCKVVLGGVKVKVNLADIKDKNNASCTGWATVNAYAWNSASNQNAGTWPGAAMAKEADGSYTYLIPDGIDPDMIIFNNGTSQTADLSITPYIVSRVEGSYTLTDGNGDIVTLPIETTTDGGNDDKTELIDIYFVKPSSWANAYIYAYYGDGTNCDKEWTKPYPGNLMTFVENDNGNAVYVGQVPKDINTIKFADGSPTNRRTDIIVDFADDICFQIGASAGTNKWYVTTYDYEVPTDPTETTTAPITEPTKPTETDPVEITTVTETDPTEATTTVPATTETEPVEYIYGDADIDGVVTIKDATLIQKYIADIEGADLEGVAFTQANVNGDAAVNVRDATYIQKYVAGIESIFPVEQTELAQVGATSAELKTLLTNVKTALDSEVYYASYVAYSNLKKAYSTYQNATSDVNAAYNAVNKAFTDYKTMKSNNPSHVNISASSGGSVSAGSTTNATSIDGLKTKPSDGAYAIRGAFNNWGNTALEYMVKGSDGTYYISYELKAGTYKFKFYNADTSAWYGNGDGSGEYPMNPGDKDWTFTTSEADCFIVAPEDGVYTFQYRLDSSGKVKISFIKK
ncbi:MAG: starch-binding protein [Ruminococcaceae bacterium]|nr:starch-binding protein [Oscillospiraceae bacterium]